MSLTMSGKKVGPIGYGLMGLSFKSPTENEESAIKALKAALDNGCNVWNGGEFYGTPERNSLTILNKYFERYPDDADKIVLNIKGCTRMPGHLPDGSRAFVRESATTCLRMLGARGAIHQFESARRDPNVPIDVTMAAMAELVAEGKIGSVALSEVSAATIREAAKTTKIAAVEIELSLFSTDALTNGVLAACAELDIPVLAYSPVGRGFLTGAIKSLDDIPPTDPRRAWPRYQPENFEINMRLTAQVEALAARKGCTPAQLAINWVRTLSGRDGYPTIIPIPGASTPERIQENATIVHISDAEMKDLADIISKFEVAGERYPAAINKYSHG